ncbi:hypothetical protein KC902_03840 [Candidatus Kaiserbacteria bacterium]|nr:hypothetical protein [Candidatus Kaiserbacteria bacterium]USN88439.1 MAG: hypothetical protein H6780_03010 [Candidatus Nomurabacteria bacterium]
MNKDTKTTEYVETLKGMKLSETSRARMQAELLEYARFHGVRVGEESRSIEQVSSPVGARARLFTLFKTPKPMTAAFLAIMLIAGGGTSFAAEGAVPGDLLYPVKTEVNETIKSALAFSSEAEAELQVNLAKERLEEAETLAARGELTAEVSADLSARLEEHYEEAAAQSNETEADGEYESSATVRASLEGSLRAAADVLTSLNAQVAGNDGSLLITNIRSYADAAATAQATATVDVSADVRADVAATVIAASDRVAMAQAKLAALAGKVSTAAYAEAEAKLAMAVAAEARAHVALESESYQTAYIEAQAAIRIAQEVVSALESVLRLEASVRIDADVNIDTILDASASSDAAGYETEASAASEAGADDSQDSSVTEVEIDAGVKADVDTDVIEVEAKTDASLRSTLSL